MIQALLGAYVLTPLDEHNAALLARVHPPDWQNPTPQPLYDLVAIGGGTAGLVAAAGTAGLGGKVALVERGLLGRRLPQLRLRAEQGAAPRGAGGL